MEQSAFKLLLLEDDHDLRDMIADVLEEQGYEVRSVSTGEEAVAAAAAEAFDLFIADIRMEGMGGLSAIEQAKDHQNDLGSLVISGWASEEETLEAVRLQVGGYLKKPFSMASLLERVTALLSVRRKEERREFEKRLLVRSALWSLETLASVCDQAGLMAPRGALQRAGEVAAKLAELDLSGSPLVEQIRVGASVAALLELSNCQPPALMEAPRELTPLFDILANYDNPDSQGAAQLAGLAIAAALGEPEEELVSVEVLENQHPDRFSSNLLEQYRALRTGAPPPAGPGPEVLLALKDPARIPRSLLSVARTMQALGDHGAAQAAYEKLLQAEHQGQQATAACLGLAALCLQARDLKAAARWALEAPRRAKPLGPNAFGQAALGCGLILQEMNHPQANASLKAASSNLQKLGLKGGAAIARVALNDFTDLEGTLSALADPTQWDLFAQAAPYILPRLLTLWRDQPPWNQLDRVILAFSECLIEVVDSLPASANLNLLNVLERKADQAAPDLLNRLSESVQPQVRARASALKTRTEGRPGPPFLRVHSLGFFEISLGPERLDDQAWRTQKTKYLVAFLLSRFSKPVLAEELVELFWPESRARAEQNLWAATSAARRAMGHAEFIVREGETLSFNWQLSYWHDFEELSKTLTEFSRTADDESRGMLSQKVSQLYVGPYLDGCYQEWAIRTRGHLLLEVSQTLIAGAHSFLRRQLYSEALELADRAIEVDPFLGDAFQMKMRAHLGLGQPEKSIQCFEQAQAMLKREFDLEPSTAMMEILIRAKHGLPDSGE